jgi:hypothetical protein
MSADCTGGNCKHSDPKDDPLAPRKASKQAGSRGGLQHQQLLSLLETTGVGTKVVASSGFVLLASPGEVKKEDKPAE